MSPSVSLLFVLAAAPQQIQFEDASEEMGVSFQHEDGAFAYAMGGGVAWFDADADGDDDLLLTSSSGRHKLFRNDAGELVDVTDASNLDLYAFNQSNIGVACADYDQDGFVDVYLTNSGQNRLFRNLGGMVFEDVTDECGVAGDSWSTSASWADFDLDGDLDLYVGNYIETLNFPYHYGDPNDFYENLGDGQLPRFVERAFELGIDDSGLFGPSVVGFPYVSPEGQATAGCTLAVCTLDYDEDGDPDLMVGNDFGLWVLADRMWRNDTVDGGPLVFTDVTAETGFAQGEEYNMGILGRDYDHDGDWDYYLTNLGDNVLLQDVGGFELQDVVQTVGPVEGTTEDGSLFLTSWGIVWEDFDHDGHEDLFVVNGYIPAATFIANDDRADDHVWRNMGDGTFERIDPLLSGIDDPGAGRGVAWTDVEGDGDLDLYVMNNGAGGVAFPNDRCRLYLNETPKGSNHWLALRLEGRSGNREALGTRVDLRAGDLELKRQVLGDPVFISSPTRALHFGLGLADTVDELTFHWTSGRVSQWLDVAADASYPVVEPAVLIQELGAAATVGGTLQLPLTLQNDADVGAQARMRVQLRANGKELVTLTKQVFVGAGSSAAAVFEVVVPPALYARYQGEELEWKTTVRAFGGIDARATTFILD